MSSLMECGRQRTMRRAQSKRSAPSSPLAASRFASQLSAFPVPSRLLVLSALREFRELRRRPPWVEIEADVLSTLTRKGRVPSLCSESRGRPSGPSLPIPLCRRVESLQPPPAIDAPQSARGLAQSKRSAPSSPLAASRFPLCLSALSSQLCHRPPLDIFRRRRDAAPPRL